MSETSLEELLIRWEDGSLPDDELEQLRSRLKSDPDAHERYVQFQLLSLALYNQAEQPANESEAPSTAHGIQQRREPKASFSVPGWLLALAATLLLVVLARWGYVEFKRADVVPQLTASREGEEQRARGVAIVTHRITDSENSNGEAEPAAGEAVLPGSFKLANGLAQIEFFCGASVVLEGPAELEIISSTEAIFHRGKLRAVVPPAARGFTIRTSDLRVVDLGTEFGMAVSDAGVQVEVYDGEVEVHSGGDKQSILAGEAFVEGQTAPGAADSERFSSAATVQQMLQSRNAARFTEWQNGLSLWLEDPTLVAAYSFENLDAGSRKLPARRRERERELDGAIVGAQLVDGRWKQKGGLAFKRPGDRVRLMVPGEFGSLTFATWVKIDSLDRQYNSLFLTDSYEQGEPHWQIKENGQIHFSVRPSVTVEQGPEHYVALSPTFWTPAMSGAWIHLAVTYDIAAGETTHFVNGQILSRHSIPVEKQVSVTRIGLASLGNWAAPTKPDEDFAIRNLNGTMDEFMMFQRALEPSEIARLFTLGKP